MYFPSQIWKFYVGFLYLGVLKRNLGRLSFGRETCKYEVIDRNHTINQQEVLGKYLLHLLSRMS